MSADKCKVNVIKLLIEDFAMETNLLESTTTLANATETGVNLLSDICGGDLGRDVLGDLGREQIGLMMLSRIRLNLKARVEG